GRPEGESLSNSRWMLQSCGRSTACHAESSYEGAWAPAGSPSMNLQPKSMVSCLLGESAAREPPRAATRHAPASIHLVRLGLMARGCRNRSTDPAGHASPRGLDFCPPSRQPPWQGPDRVDRRTHPTPRTGAGADRKGGPDPLLLRRDRGPEGAP